MMSKPVNTLKHRRAYRWFRTVRATGQAPSGTVYSRLSDGELVVLTHTRRGFAKLGECGDLVCRMIGFGSDAIVDSYLRADRS